MSALDAAFLGLETPDVPFVHASILQFDRRIPVETLRSHLASAFTAVPRFRQRVERHRFSARWVDDDGFRIDRHVFAVTAAPPGGQRELDALVAKLLETRLPTDRPLWRAWTVEGLADGRGAVIALVHHSLVDGIAGIRLLERLLGAPRAATRPAPARARKLFAWKNVAALGRLLREGFQPADEIGLNPRHTSRRRAVASYTIDRGALKQIERAFDVTNNDVVLAMVAGALRRMLIRRGRDPMQQHDVRVMVPVGRHSADPDDISGNKVALLLVQLPVDIDDPIDRLMHVNVATRRLKRSRRAPAGDLLVALSQLSTPALLVGVLRLGLAARAFNTVVTNVPGPRQQLSLFGAALERIVPIVNLWPHGSLGIAVASYANTMTFGLHVDRTVIPDVERLRDDLAASLDELFALALQEVAA